MGGDMIYDVPKRPGRPTERALVYVGHVAHTKTTAKPNDQTPEPSDAGSGPVVPIGSAPHEAVSPPPSPLPSGSPDGSPAAADAGVAGDAAVSTL
jgi:hypothetical protein